MYEGIQAQVMLESFSSQRLEGLLKDSIHSADPVAVGTTFEMLHRRGCYNRILWAIVAQDQDLETRLAATNTLQGCLTRVAKASPVLGLLGAAIQASTFETRQKRDYFNLEDDFRIPLTVVNVQAREMQKLRGEITSQEEWKKLYKERKFFSFDSLWRLSTELYDERSISHEPDHDSLIVMQRLACYGYTPRTNNHRDWAIIALNDPDVLVNDDFIDWANGQGPKPETE